MNEDPANDPAARTESYPALRLLIAEDRADQAASMGALLAHSKVELHGAGNGVDALAKVRSMRPHVAVIDVALPVLDGFEVFRALRREGLHAGTRTILVGDTADRHAFLLAKDLGAHAGLIRPFDASHLRRTVLAALGVSEEAAGRTPARASAAALLGLDAPLTPSATLPRGTVARCRHLALVSPDRSLLGPVRAAVNAAVPHAQLHYHRLGRDALRGFVLRPPDGLLLDLHLPDLDGLALVARLARGGRLARCPVILIAADASPRLRGAAIAAGAAAFVAKPVDVEHLRGTLAHAFGPAPRAAPAPAPG